MNTYDESNLTPPDEFIELTKDALDHLYDFDKLSNHRLARWLLSDHLPRGISRAQALRQRLINAIEHLDPGHPISATARQNRSFHLLELRYVEAMSFNDVMRTLALSQTQYHREQRRAVGMVAAYLWENLPGASSNDLQFVSQERERSDVRKSAKPDSLQSESAVSRAEDEVHLASFLADVLQLMDKIAAQQSVHLRLASIDDEPVLTDRTTLRNAAISSIGFLLGQVREGEIIVASNRLGATVRIDIIGRGVLYLMADDVGLAEKLRWSRELMHAIGGVLTLERAADHEILLCLELPPQRPTVLVIDDNPDLVQLIKRYLIDQDYAVVSAGSVEEGISAAESIHPNVILLDVMMPHRDGWDALQILRHHPTTTILPIVVCTVLAENQLAQALGATAFIRKPLTRPALLQVLAQVLPGRPLVAAKDPAGTVPHAISGESSEPDR